MELAILQPRCQSQLLDNSGFCDPQYHIQRLLNPSGWSPSQKKGYMEVEKDQGFGNQVLTFWM